MHSCQMQNKREETGLTLLGLCFKMEEHWQIECHIINSILNHYFYIHSILESEEKQIEPPRRPTIANLKGLKASFRKQIQRPITTRFPSYSKSGFTDTFKFIHFKRLAMPEQKMSVLMIVIAIVFVVRFLS